MTIARHHILTIIDYCSPKFSKNKPLIQLVRKLPILQASREPLSYNPANWQNVARRTQKLINFGD